MMPNFLPRLCLLLACACSALPALSATAPAGYKTNLPPSADLIYSITAQQKGLTINGNAHIEWRAANGKYSVGNETRAMMFGKILEEKSEGLIDSHGLAPLSFTQKRYRKEPASASFDRQAGVIRFAGSPQTYPIKGGEQDRGSAIWQLISVARAAPARFKPGSNWTFFVAGLRDADPWTFKVVSQEKIRTPLGEMAAVHVQKEPPPDKPKDQQIDIWLAPSLEWFPVQLRYTEADGDTIEQALEQVIKK